MKPFRIYILLFGFVGIYIVLAVNLYDLQIIKGYRYSALAESQYRLAGFLEPHRGVIAITDKNNAVIPVAINTSYPVVVAVPREIKDRDQTVENISPIINKDGERVRELITKKGAYQVLLKNPTPEQMRAIAEANIYGIHIDEQERREYPFGVLASHVLGFVGPQGDDPIIAGRYGLEQQFNAALAGMPGSQENGKAIKPVQGKDIIITIDRAIQSQGETILKNLVQTKKAVGGTVIVQEPKTGKVLAMASAPDFNPNEYGVFSLHTFVNPAVQGRYEPGSVFKVITAAIGLDTKSFTPQTTYYDTGAVKFSDGKIIKNWDLKAHGTMTMTNVIEESLNTGAAFMQRAIGNKPFYDYLNTFGFNDRTGIALPGEISGNLKNIKTRAADIHFATASFGQGIAVTPLQLITAVSAIANGGMLMKPYIEEKKTPETVRRVVTPEAARAATEMMISAVRKGEIAHIPHYTVAGKTGTAQAVDFVQGGYTNEVINTYVGFAPARNPRFIILIKLDKPAGAPLAGTTVVPAFRELAEFIINYYGIPPDNLPREPQ